MTTTPALGAPDPLVPPRPRHRADDLLRAWLPGSFLYVSPQGALLADGVHAEVRGGTGSHAAAAAAALASASVADPVVVGAIGFDPASPASLVVPAVVRRSGPFGGPPASVPAPATGWVTRQAPPVAEYVDGVRRALDLIDDGVLRKIVLARGLELTASGPVDVTALLARLAAADPSAHAFAVDVTAPGDRAPRTLVGASPELLVSRRGDRVTAHPLAGSTPRTGDAVADRTRIDTLLTSEKDRHEHAFVAEQVAEVLGRFCVDVDRPAEPSVVGTASMWHLGSRISGRLVDTGVSALALAEALHPTPAVCGVPRDAARTAISALEPVDRGYYGGLVGWTDASGDGEWVVTIRSAEVCADTVRLFAGAGVVAGSTPDAELAETTAKFATMLRAVGASA